MLIKHEIDSLANGQMKLVLLQMSLVLDALEGVAEIHSFVVAQEGIPRLSLKQAIRFHFNPFVA